MLSRAVAVVCVVGLGVTSLSARAEEAVRPPSDMVELFVDRAETYIRAGTEQGLEVGDTVAIVGDRIGDTDERRTIGSASVLEVWKRLARVSLDAAARNSSGEKHARVGDARASTSARKAPSEGVPAELQGRVWVSGVGPARRIVVHNTGDTAWRRCDVRLPSNKHYVLEGLEPDASEGIMLFRFTQDGVQHDLPTTFVHVKCANGEARFPLSI
ncbi:MAG: hypothetical protein L0Y66_00935 [Myxococcaceae bacterium]|nr:hypothetical protein [Myxococcaceae bacterium]MCI0673855.1 hypothetical protein [Myxococcaceae bacterium]